MSAAIRASVLVAAGMGILALGVRAGESDGGGWIKTRLDLLHGDGAGGFAPKIGLQLGPQEWEGRQRDLPLGSAYMLGGVAGNLVHVWDKRLEYEPSFLGANGGGFWSLKEYERADQLPTAPERVAAGIAQYDYGRLYLTAHARAEADDNAENLNVAGGGDLTYTPGNAFAKRLIALPSLGVSWEYVKPERTAAREAVGADASAFPRMRAFALWNWSFGENLASRVPIVQNCHLRLHYRYAREFDQPEAWVNAGFDTYDQFDAVLRYLPDAAKRRGLGLREIYAGYAVGRQIAHAEDDGRILVGILLQ